MGISHPFPAQVAAVEDDDGAPRIFFSSLGSDDGDVYGGVLAWRDGALAEVLRDAPRVHGLAVLPDGGACGGAWLVYADATRGLLAKRPTCASTFGAPGDAHEVLLASGLVEPRGVAVDPHVEAGAAHRTLYATAATNVVKFDDSPKDAFEVVVKGQSHSAPDGILLLPIPSGTSSRGDRSQRLLWLDANKPAVKSATAAGTRQSNLPIPPDPLRFPRALALDDADGALLVGEWLGRVWKAPTSMTSALLLRDDDSTLTAKSVRATVDDEERARTRLQAALVTLLKL